MAKRPAKKPEKQLDLPAPAPPLTTKVLPMQLKPGDRLTDSTGEWEVIGRPYTTAGGKNARVRVRQRGQSGGGEERMRGGV